MCRKQFPCLRALVAAALVSPLFVVASPAASAGPAGPDALQVISQLQRQGDRVVVHRTGDGPLQLCVVTSVREGKSAYWWTSPRTADPNPRKRANGVGTQLIYRTVDVDVRC